MRPMIKILITLCFTFFLVSCELSEDDIVATIKPNLQSVLEQRLTEISNPLVARPVYSGISVMMLTVTKQTETRYQGHAQIALPVGYYGLPLKITVQDQQVSWEVSAEEMEKLSKAFMISQLKSQNNIRY